MPFMDRPASGGFLPVQDTRVQPQEEDTTLTDVAKVGTVVGMGAGLVLAPLPTLGAMATIGGGSLLADKEGAKAAFRTENTIGSMLSDRSGKYTGDFDPGYDPWDDIGGTEFEPYWENFASARTREHADLIKQDIVRERRDREYLESQGMLGFAQQMAAGIFDLPSLLPGGAVVRTAKGASKLGTALKVGAFGAAGAGITEGVLQSTQELRTPEESAMNIAGATILSGVLGYGMASRMNSAEMAALGKRIERDFTPPDRSKATPSTEPQPSIPREMDALETELRQTLAQMGPHDDSVALELQDELIRIDPNGSTRNELYAIERDDGGDFGIPARRGLSGEGKRDDGAGEVPPGERPVAGALAGESGATAKGGPKAITGTEAFPIEGFTGVRTAEVPASGKIAARVYRVYPEGVKVNRLKPPLKSLGKALGWVRISQHPDGRWEVANVEINKGARRQKIATRLYDQIEADLGIKMRPSGHLEPDGFAFWKNRNPELVKSHRYSVLNGQYLSPRQIKGQLEFVKSEIAKGIAEPTDRAKWLRERDELQSLWDELPAEVKTKPALDQMFALRAFHGSPHDFDKFDMSRIGTGEGAQAFGHGLYFAENADVAGVYQYRVSGQHADWNFDGIDLRKDREFLKLIDGLDAEGNWPLANLLREVDSLRRQGWQQDEIIRERRNWHRNSKKMLAAIDEFEKRSTLTPKNGQLYEVEIDVEPEQLLDWDLPLSEQSDTVKSALNKFIEDNVPSDREEMFLSWLDADGTYMSGEGLYRHLQDQFTPEQVAQALREAGVPGIRYLDQGSRGTSDGTRNIVLFDDSLVKITRKNGKPVTGEERQGVVDQMFSLRSGSVTETPAFKRWFGGSKVVDENGKPLVVYHGTINDIEQFDITKFGRIDSGHLGRGFYFSDTADQARVYAGMAGFAEDERLHIKGVGLPEGGVIYPVYLKIEKPFYTTAGELNDLAKEAGLSRTAYVESLRNQGYDGVITKYQEALGPSSRSEEYVVFDPTQIKSAIGNRGTFDPTDPRISMAMRRDQQGELVAEAKFEREKMLITISRAALDPVNNMHHEVVHALKARGLFRPDEWRLIEASAKSKGWLDNPLIKDYQKVYGRSLDDESIIEEAFALAFQRHVKGEEIQKGAMAKIFDRIMAYLQRIGNYIRGHGPQTVEDLFRAIEQGDIGARAAPEGRTDATSPGFTAAGAQTSQEGSLKLKGALGTEKALAFLSPAMRLQNSPSRAARAWVNELAETALTYEDHKSWIPTARGGAELGQPGSVETRVKLYDTNIAAGFKALDNLFIRYRKGSAKRIPGDLTVASLRDATAGPPTGKMDYRQFREAVSAAMRRGDEHDIPEVAEAAKVLRKEVFDPLLQRAIELELLPEDVTPETAASYLNRIYNKERIVAERTEFRDVIVKWLQETEIHNAQVRGRISSLLEQFDAANKTAKLATQRQKVRAKRDLERARSGKEIDTEKAAAKESADASILSQQNAIMRDVRKQIEELVESYQGKSADEAKSALKARGKVEEGREADAERLASADKAVMKAAKKIAAQTEKETIELVDTAEQIIDRILGTPEGRLPYDAGMNKTPNRNYGGVEMDMRGPLAARQFMIPDARIEQWLENDVDHLIRAYVHTMAPDVELTARFGSPDMVLQFKQINEEYARMAAATDNPKIRKRLHEQKKQDFLNLGAIRDRLRGTYALPDNPDGIMVRAVRGLMTFNYLRLLGGMTISALPDVARFIHVQGMRTFGDGIIPMFRNISAYKKAGDETKWLSGALELVTDNRAMRIADITDTFGRNTKFERAVQSAGRQFGMVSLMAPWNAVMKQLAGTITQTRILRGAERLISGKPLKQTEMEYFAHLGISQDALRQIGEQFKKHGAKENNVWTANTAEWDEGSRPAIEALRVGLRKEVDNTIVTPSHGEKPRMASTLTGAMLLQFKSFAISATQKMLISGLQQRDMNALNAAVIAIALGGLVHIIKGKVSGHYEEIDWGNDDDVKQFLGNAFDRSGMAGVLMEFNNIAEKVTDGRVGLSALTGKPISRYASRNVTASLLGPGFGLAEDSFAALNAALGTREWKERDTHNARQLLPYNNLFYLRSAFDNAEKGINQALGVPAR